MPFLGWNKRKVGLTKKAALLLFFATMILSSISTAGCIQAGVTKNSAIWIHDIQLCSAIYGEGDYKIQPDAAFNSSDVVWLYCEVHGIRKTAADGKWEYWVKFSELKVYGPDGNMVAENVDVVEIHETLDEASDYVWFGIDIQSPSDAVVGQYRCEFIVKDELSGATGTGSATFTLQ